MEVNDGVVKAPVKGLDYADKGETAFYISTRIDSSNQLAVFKLPVH